MLANKLQRTLWTNVLDALREVRSKKQRKVDESCSIKMQSRANLRARDEDKGLPPASKVADQGGFVDDDILQKTSEPVLGRIA